ncbi:MAG: TrlF family AAA-like ATPase [Candidatus Scalindua sp.]
MDKDNRKKTVNSEAWPGGIKKALNLHSGAKYFRCALQVNPFGYLKNNRDADHGLDEQRYNSQLVGKCEELQIKAIAITDHNHVGAIDDIRKKAESLDITVLPGFEVSSSEGVHVLCIFDQNKEIDVLERYLGDLGIHTTSPSTTNSSGPFSRILNKVQREWDGICVAAHITNNGGLLRVLTGEARINAWRDSNLYAVQIPGSIDDLEYADRQIILNKNKDYKRHRKIAVVNASDVVRPEDLESVQASTYIKMSFPGVEGLKQAFLDPDSRIRLLSEEVPPEHTEFIALHWEGGFLDGAAIHLNGNLNVLIGGRGTGKSTIIESLRYVLDLEPFGEEAKKASLDILKKVIRSGTKISLLVRSHHPSGKDYMIERTYPNPPVIRDVEGNVLSLTPKDICRNVEIYGQHEIGELTRLPGKLSRLLDRFIDEDPHLSERKRSTLKELAQNRRKLVDIQKELIEVSENIRRLPALEETLARFKEAGLEERLKDQSLLVKEEQILKTALSRLSQIRDGLDSFQIAAEIDRAFVSELSLKDLPGRETLRRIDSILALLETNLKKIIRESEEYLKTSEADIDKVSQEWEKRRKEVQDEYEKLLRELQKEAIDGEEFLKLRRQIEGLKPLRDRQEKLKKEKEALSGRRSSLLTDWEDLKESEFRAIERAAKKANKKLNKQVRVTVSFCGNREPLFDMLRQRIGGRLSEAIDTLGGNDDISLPAFVETCRKGAIELQNKFYITTDQARRITEAGEEIFMELEELYLPHPANMELNIGSPDRETWKGMNDLSTGQKATTILLLLLLESDAPIIIDQPEDDLDNFFIAEGIIPKMREEKLRRQFIFSTHNANIPVLGDAELIVGLRAVGEASGGHGEIPVEWMGSIDDKIVRLNVEQILEGGKDAFEIRRAKYGF